MMSQLQTAILPTRQELQAQPVAREDWKAFLAEFSRRHKGWLAGFRVREKDGGSESVIARQLPLVEMQFDEGGNRIWTHLGAGKNRRILYPVEDPIFLQVDVGADGAEWGLEIDFDGGTAVLRFRSSLPTEMVDGIAPLPS